MNDTQVWQAFTDIAVRVASTVLITLICWGVKEGIAWLKTRVQNERIKAALDELQRVTIDGIYYIEQTAVKAYKEAGAWDQDTQEQVLEECRDYIVKTLTEETKQLLVEDNAQILEDYITSKIEAELGWKHERSINLPLTAQDDALEDEEEDEDPKDVKTSTEE